MKPEEIYPLGLLGGKEGKKEVGKPFRQIANSVTCPVEILTTRQLISATGRTGFGTGTNGSKFIHPVVHIGQWSVTVPASSRVFSAVSTGPDFYWS